MPTSPKKSKRAAPHKQTKSQDRGDFSGFEATIETPADRQIASLQNDLATEKDERLEERFGAVVQLHY